MYGEKLCSSSTAINKPTQYKGHYYSHNFYENIMI